MTIAHRPARASWAGAIARFSLFEREPAAPAVLHADDSPAALGRFVAALLRILSQIEVLRDTRTETARKGVEEGRVKPWLFRRRRAHRRQIVDRNAAGLFAAQEAAESPPHVAEEPHPGVGAERTSHSMTTRNLDALFEPKSIALIDGVAISRVLSAQ